MKKLQMLGLATAVSFIVGCTGGDDSSDTINILGTWNVTSTSPLCPGLVANAIQIVESNNGNDKEIGTVHYQGTMFNFVNGTCNLIPTSSSYRNFTGYNSMVSEPDFMNYFAGLGLINDNQYYISGSDISSFTDSLVSMNLSFKDGRTFSREFKKQ